MTDPVQPNKNDEVTVIEANSTPNVATVSESARLAPAKSGGQGLSIVAMLFSLIALGLTVYSFYVNEIRDRDEESRLAIDIVEIRGNANRLKDSISRLEDDQNSVVTNEQLTTKILEANSAVDLQLRDVKQGQAELLGAVAKINDDLSSGVNEFIVAEVSQLLKLANNSALFSSDTRSAIKALQLADMQLKELADPRYSLVRRKINEEIELLESVEQLDIESVTVKLKSLASRIPSLSLENDVPVLGDVVIEIEEKPSGFRASLEEIWADIVNYNSVQRIDQAPKPLLLPEQRYFLNQNIQLQLAKAELGLLQNRQAIYSESLDAAMSWLEEYFDLRDDDVNDVLSQIGELKTLSLSKELPPISGSYSELQDIRGGR